MPLLRPLLLQDSYAASDWSLPDFRCMQLGCIGLLGHIWLYFCCLYAWKLKQNTSGPFEPFGPVKAHKRPRSTTRAAFETYQATKNPFSAESRSGARNWRTQKKYIIRFSTRVPKAWTKKRKHVDLMLTSLFPKNLTPWFQTKNPGLRLNQKVISSVSLSTIEWPNPQCPSLSSVESSLHQVQVYHFSM